MTLIDTLSTTPAASVPDGALRPGETALSARPDALLLDFGGVVFTTRKRPEAPAEVARIVSEVLARAGHHRAPSELESVLRGGAKALSDWKNSQSRRLRPAEIDHRTIWRDFYGAPLPRPEREVLAGHAGWLQYELTTRSSEHLPGEGIVELLDTASSLGIPVGIVSNAHSGRAHRSILESTGLAAGFAVQLYSDEVGIRKPHPGIIELAATALKTVPERCWYVGDTFDRDVVAGRRAGVGAVVLTRSHHTDAPPFPVSERADLVVDAPRDLVDPLSRSCPGPRHEQALRAADSVVSTEPAESTRSRSARPLQAPMPSAILLDHGGVISTSSADDAALTAFAERFADGLSGAGHPTSARDAMRALEEGRRRHKEWKAANEGAGGEPIREVDPITFWVELVGPGLPGGDSMLAWLHAEAHPLMYDYARAKSARTLRSGVVELLRAARESGVPVGVVSNTVSGRAVRDELKRQGIEDLVAAHAYSDETGHRKPDPEGVREVLAALDAAPERAWFIGDKPHRDVPAARRGGVGTVALVRGGSTTEAQFRQQFAASPDFRPDHLVDSIDDLLPLIFPDVPSDRS